MTRKIGARKDGQQQAMSTAPSYNKTPVGSATPPLPYPTVAKLDNAVATVGSVRLNGKPVLVLDQSKQPTCVGDNPGVAKGVKSGTLNGEVKPTQGSSNVRAGGKPVIRLGDPCTMQGGNNPGIYTVVPAVAGIARAAVGAGLTATAVGGLTEAAAAGLDAAADVVLTGNVSQVVPQLVAAGKDMLLNRAEQMLGKIPGAGKALEALHGGSKKRKASDGGKPGGDKKPKKDDDGKDVKAGGSNPLTPTRQRTRNPK